jgi:uncharacterized protein
LNGTSGKNRANQAKHKVSFETAALVFEDPRAITLADRIVEDEQRWHTLGMVRGIAIVLVAHMELEEHGEVRIRIISARKATRHERKIYEEGL